MPEKVVASDQWGEIIHYKEWDTLELKWLASTKDAKEADLRGTMVLFASESEKVRPASLIVDTTKFFHRWADGMMEWRNETIIPQYNAAGVSKFAFIAGSDFPGPTVDTGATPAPDGPANFPTGWFKTRDAAYAWLTG